MRGVMSIFMSREVVVTFFLAVIMKAPSNLFFQKKTVLIATFVYLAENVFIVDKVCEAVFYHKCI